jgi:hypothetical protein
MHPTKVRDASTRSQAALHSFSWGVRQGCGFVHFSHMPAACGTFRGAARGGFLGRYHVRHHVFGGLLSGLLVRYYTLGHVLGEGRLMSRHCYHGVYTLIVVVGAG